MESVLKPMDLADADPVTRFLFNRMRDERKGDRISPKRSAGPSPTGSGATATAPSDLRWPDRTGTRLAVRG